MIQQTEVFEEEEVFDPMHGTREHVEGKYLV